ncbi:MAG TPA: hypothetical protein VF239_05645 [Vicinamibacterales bacterium]|jgi:uncharacterized protein YndB with AHSA1/START domain
MGLVIQGLRPAAALFVIAHGLAHAVLPLRGWMQPDLLQNDAMPAILYAVAVLGFITAGIGLFGVKPFTAVVRPFLVLASAYSLIAIFTFGAGDLWWGGLVDAGLLLVGLSGVYKYLPAATPHPGLPHRLGVAIAAAFVLYVACAMVLWPVHRAWGSTPGEYAIALPGDGADRNPAIQIQHAVTVNAPPEAVWPWLAQLGQDRAGFYSYDWLERAFGVDIRNVKELRPEWQARAEGDFVPATQPGYLGMFEDSLGWRVTKLEPGRAMVLEHWGAFVLQPTSDGKTRFIVRSTISHERIPAWQAALNMMAFQLPHFIMERKMMLQIKQLAEQRRG